ncbi:MAG: purine-nucleoside phosphorylase [Planctomycetales bacterium]|nr:purine-nucleoside phosphorylase [Planctomycetales bacterium]
MSSPEFARDVVQSAADVVRRRWADSGSDAAGDARVGIILGTGLGDLADHIAADVVLPYREIPGFPHSTALSHKSRLICGRLDGVPVVTMQGRCHLYEGYPVSQLALPVRVMHALGVRTLVVSNASGGVNPHYAAGDIMILADHINLMWTSPQDTLEATSPLSARQHAAPYTTELIELAERVARREQFVAHRGVYVAVTGPTYETRAEYRLFRRIGGDVVGMSTVPEVIAAAQCGMQVLALSLVTNVAKPDAPEQVDADEVVEAAAAAAPRMHKIVQELLLRRA